ncbi:hypothetical protein D9619_008494 [Psilocybe cf. subviscida]|uniref:Uncharacterized protein n=1 Tax=Psilocybe cf. subviscida TaxID=2480587 RepID=A0A8H5BAD6_9AGAR|nr:hypothetical protein D9619_008494 [Psilocybe cf. subviscida]
MAAVVDRHWQSPPHAYHAQQQPHWAASIPPKNDVELTGTQLVNVLEHFSNLLQQAFGLGQPGAPPSMRFVVHGGACMLLHPGLQRLSRQQERNQPNMPRRTTTRDVDYLHRGFKQEYGHLPDAERRLRECILYTAAAFKLGADWMNADADVALPMANKPDGRPFDPIYDASLDPVNVKLHTVYQSHNGYLTLISVSPFWSVALKLVRFAKWDPGDVVLLLRNGTVLSGVNWTAEKIEHWLKTACWPMRYDTYTPLQMAGLRTRIHNSLKLLNDWNRDVVGSSPPEAVTGGRELTAWQTASNWQASAHDPVTPQIAMGVDSALANPPQWAFNQSQQDAQRDSHSPEESPVRITGRSLGRNSSPPSREPSRQPTPFIPPPPDYGDSPESGSYMDDVQDHPAGSTRRSRSRARQNQAPVWRNSVHRERSTQREQREAQGFLLGPIDRALRDIIDRGEIAVHPGVLNIVPAPQETLHSPTSAHYARRRQDKQRATERNHARGAKHHQDYGHSDSDPDSSEDDDSDDDRDKENRRGRDMETRRRGRRPHEIYAPSAPNRNIPGPSTHQTQAQAAPSVELEWYEVPARIGSGPAPAPRRPPRASTPSPEPEFNRSRSKWGTERRRPEPLDSQPVNVPPAASYHRPATVIPAAMTYPAPVVRQASAAPVIPIPTASRDQDAPRRRRRAAVPSEQPWERAVAPPSDLTDPAQLAQYQFEEQRRRFEEEKEVKRLLAERERQFYQPPPTPDAQPMTQEQQAQYQQQQQQLQQLEQQQQHARQTLYRQHYQQQFVYHPPAAPGPPPPWLQQPQQQGGYLYR